MRQAIRVLKTPVTLILLLAILGFGAQWGYQQIRQEDAVRDTPCVIQDVGKELTPEKVTVRVLNGGEAGGHAKRTREFLLAYDFWVIYYNNSDRRVTTTTVVGHSADDPEVQLVAKMFNDVVTEGDGRIDHVVDVIVPTKYQERENPEKPSIAVDGPVCLPTIHSSSPNPSSTVSTSPTPAPSGSPTK